MVAFQIFLSSTKNFVKIWHNSRNYCWRLESVNILLKQMVSWILGTNLTYTGFKGRMQEFLRLGGGLSFGTISPHENHNFYLTLKASHPPERAEVKEYLQGEVSKTMILITWLLARFYGWSSIWTNKYWHVQSQIVPIWCQSKTDRIIFVFHSTLSKLIISKKGTWIFRQLNGEERSEEKICIFKIEKRRYLPHCESTERLKGTVENRIITALN